MVIITLNLYSASHETRTHFKCEHKSSTLETNINIHHTTLNLETHFLLIALQTFDCDSDKT